MQAGSKKDPIGFQKNKVTRLGDGSNQMRNAGMIERLASRDPNNRGAAGNNLPNPLVRNRMIGIVMQKFRRFHELHGASALGKLRLVSEMGQRETR
ncbi:MAG TPA: hypothetical protein VMR90_11045 [Candidatus Cybelea sp.]|nr:hypothetical protein [Candidatus Cybelea sp.]